MGRRRLAPKFIQVSLPRQLTRQQCEQFKLRGRLRPYMPFLLTVVQGSIRFPLTRQKSLCLCSALIAILCPVLEPRFWATSEYPTIRPENIVVGFARSS